MTPTDHATLQRYATIIQSLIAAPPQGSRVQHNRPIHAALQEYDRLVSRSDTSTPPILSHPFRAADGENIAAQALRAAATSPAALDALIHSQQPTGEFLPTTARDNPETHWYHELILLHAITLHAVKSGEDAIWRAVERAAMFHLNETQPDHATAEPWALFAFVRTIDTLPLADLILHTVQTAHPGGLDRISWMLLHHALYCINMTPEG